MNSSALGSRSLSRKGDGSIASNNCFNSPTCTSMTAHFGGSGSPAEVGGCTITLFDSLGSQSFNHGDVLKQCCRQAVSLLQIRRAVVTHPGLLISILPDQYP